MSGALRRCSISSRPTRGATALMHAQLHSCTVFLLALLLCLGLCVSGTSKKKDSVYLSTMAGSGGVYTLYTVTGCSECTVNLSQRWCPSTMRCYPANNCTCEGPVPCIDLRTCFYGSQPRCRECVDSGGVYCAGGSSMLTPQGSGGSQVARCYPPDVALLSRGDGTSQSKDPRALAIRGDEADARLPTCGASTCLRGQCIQRAAECPVEAADPLMRSYEVICVMVVLILSSLVLRNLYKLVF